MHDINNVMPKLSKVINGCGYDPVNHVMGFRVEDYAVVIDGRQILIIGAENEMQARSVLDWLTDKINGNEIAAKLESKYIYHNKLSKAG